MVIAQALPVKARFGTSEPIALIQQLQLLIALIVQPLEIAHHFAHLADHREGVRHAANDGGQGRGLGFVDHTDEDGSLPPQIHALAGHQRGAVVQLMDDGIADALGIVRHDLEADGASAGFGQLIGDGAGGEAVHNAQKHRLNLEIIHKVGDQRHRRVQAEQNIEEVHIGAFFVNDGGDKIGAAGVGAGPDEQGVAAAVNDAGHQRAEDGAGAVFRGVGKIGKIHIFQHHKADGEYHHIHHAAHGHRAADLAVNPDGQGDVDQQAHVAHADACQILYHGTQSVDTGGRKPVGENKQVVIDRADHRDPRDAKIGQRLFHAIHEPPPGRTYFIQSTTNPPHGQYKQ